MNWKTIEILKEAKALINNDGVFSLNQVALLQSFVDLIAEAIARESDCNRPSITL